jgi:hypothetical protein
MSGHRLPIIPHLPVCVRGALFHPALPKWHDRLPRRQPAQRVLDETEGP